MEPLARYLRIHHLGENVLGVSFQDVELLFERDVVQNVGDELYDLVNRFGDHRIILSFRGINYVSSEMLGKMVSMRRRVIQKGGELILCHMDVVVRDVFASSHLDSLFEIVADEAAALVHTAPAPGQKPAAG